MFGGDWKQQLAAFGLIFVVGVGGGLFLSGIEVSERPRAETSDPYACEKGDYTNCNTKPTFLDPSTGEPSSYNADGKSYREEYRAERDLAAQSQMATWAAYMTVATGIGIILLFFTWIETRRGVAETQRIGEKQVQAYLTVSEVKLWLREFNGELGLSANMAIKNKGHSPASDISITYECILLTPLKSSKIQSWSAYVIDEEDQTFCRDIAPNDDAVALLEFNTFPTGSIAESTFRSQQSIININGTIHWTNEFGNPQNQPFHLHSARFLEGTFNNEYGIRKGQIDLFSGGRRSGNDAERIRNKYYSGNE